MNLDELNELDFSNIGGWPAPARIAVVVVIAIVVLFLGYWFDVKDQITELERVEQQESELKQKFEARARKAANLQGYEAQLEEMRESFGAMLRQLPNKTEVAELLVDISQTGLASGLEFDLFKPQGEKPRDFYAVLPISIKVRGDYHEFGAFVSGVAALPRIVTVHDVNIQPGKNTGGDLTMTLLAKTYRYLDEDEEGAKKGDKKGKKKGGKKK